MDKINLEGNVDISIGTKEIPIVRVVWLGDLKCKKSKWKTDEKYLKLTEGMMFDYGSSYVQVVTTEALYGLFKKRIDEIEDLKELSISWAECDQLVIVGPPLKKKNGKYVTYVGAYLIWS